MDKKFRNLKIFLTFGAITLLSSLFSIYALQSSVPTNITKNSIINLNDNQVLNKSNKAVVDTGDFLLETNNAVSLKDYIVYSNRPAISGENGVLVYLESKLNKGKYYLGYIPYNSGGVVTWKTETYDVMDMFYEKEKKFFVVLERTVSDHQQNKIRVSVYDEITFAKKGNYMYPYSVTDSEYRLYRMSRYCNEYYYSEYIIMPRSFFIKQSEKLHYTKQISIDPNGSISELTNANYFVDNWNKESWLLGFKGTLHKRTTKYVLATIIADENKDIWVRVFEEFKMVADWRTGLTVNDSFNNNDLTNLYNNAVGMACIPYFDTENNKSYVNFKYIIPGNNSQLLDFTYIMGDKKIVNQKVINLNNVGNLDIDFNQKMQWVGNKLYALPAYLFDDYTSQKYQNSVVVLQINNESPATDNLFTPTGDQAGNMQIYSTTSKDVNRTKSVNVVGNDTNFALISNSTNTGDTSYMWLVDTTLNNGQGGWAWSTGTKSSSDVIIALENATELYAIEYKDNEKLKPLINKEKIMNIASRMRTDFEYEFAGFNESLSDVYMGQIKCNLVIKNAYVDGNFTGTDYGTNIPITITGFYKYLTKQILESGTIPPDNPYAQKAASSLSNEKLKIYIYKNIDNFVKDLPTNFTINDIEIVDVNDYNDLGIKEFKIRLKKYVNAQHELIIGNMDLPFSIKGFSTLSTFIMSGILEGFNNVLASDVETVSDNLIKEAIIIQKKVGNIAPDKILEISDIELVGRTNNDIKGSIRYDEIIINNSKAWENGVIKQQMVFTDVIFSGFKQIKPTDFAANKTIDGSQEFGNIIADGKGQSSEKNIKKYIFDHMDLFIINPVVGMLEKDFYLIEFTPNIFAGSISFKIVITNFYNSTNGSMNNQFPLISELFTITGFNNEGMGTNIISPINISGLGYASDYANNLGDSNLIQAIIDSGNIKNIINGPLTLNDIELLNPSKLNDLTGQMTATIRIKNNKYQENGITQANHDFNNILIKGFKTRNPTEAVAKREINDIEFRGRVSDYNDELVIKFIENNINKFFINTPPNITRENFNVVITRDKGLGRIELQLTLKKYYSSTNGLLVDGDRGISNIFFLVGFEIEKSLSTSLRKNLDNITYESSLFKQIFNNDKGFYADWIFDEMKLRNQEKLKNYMNKNIFTFLDNYTNGIISTSVHDVAMVTIPEKKAVSFNVVFNNWFIGDIAQTKTYPNAIFIYLKKTPKGNSFVSMIISSLFYEMGSKLKSHDVKEIIVDQLNENKNNLPNSSIPNEGRFTIENTGLDDLEIDITDAKLSIPDFVIGSGESAIVFDAMSFDRFNIESNQDIVSLIAILTSTALILIILSLLLISYVIKNQRFKQP